MRSKIPLAVFSVFIAIDVVFLSAGLIVFLSFQKGSSLPDGGTASLLPFAIISASFFLILLFPFVFFLRGYRKEKHLLEHGFPADATIVDIQNSLVRVNRIVQLNVKVRFLGMEKTEKYVNPVLLAGKKPGDRVRIKYNQENPDEFIILEEGQPSQPIRPM